MLKILVFLFVIHAAYSMPKKDKRITYAKQTDGPWTVLLVIRGNHCTGSLVNHKYVVTAAHCFNELENHRNLAADIKIKIGEWIIGKDPDCDSDENNNSDYLNSDECNADKVAEIPIKKLKIHPDYMRRLRSNDAKKSSFDVAVIELKRPPKVSTIIQSIELPDEDMCEEDLTGDVMYTGFGEIKQKHYTTKKKKLILNLFDQTECKKKIGKTFDEEKHFCGIGANNMATCRGDSGGPAVNQVNGKFTLQGIVSFGSPECGVGDTPSGFVKVACFADWIKANTNENIENTPRTSTRPPRRSKTTTTTTIEPPNDANGDGDGGADGDVDDDGGNPFD